MSRLFFYIFILVISVHKRSLISKSLMKYVDDAKEKLRLMSVISMFYSFPQKYVVGLDD